MCIAGGVGLDGKEAGNVTASTCSSSSSSTSGAGATVTGVNAAAADADIPKRLAALNGSLGFYKLGVEMPVKGSFTLTRTMAWIWDEGVQAYTTEVRAFQGCCWQLRKNSTKNFLVERICYSKYVFLASQTSVVCAYQMNHSSSNWRYPLIPT